MMSEEEVNDARHTFFTSFPYSAFSVRSFGRSAAGYTCMASSLWAEDWGLHPGRTLLSLRRSLAAAALSAPLAATRMSAAASCSAVA